MKFVPFINSAGVFFLFFNPLTVSAQKKPENIQRPKIQSHAPWPWFRSGAMTWLGGLGLIILCSQLSAQTINREVSGIVKETTTDNSVIGATVTLTTGSGDSIRAGTNIDGAFVFKNVRSGRFILTVRGIGYETYTKPYLYSDSTQKIILNPITLKNASRTLDEVVINGTPSITYKIDTVEYRASDYVTKPNASVEDLIKKMEGVEVGTDGKVTHQGETIARVRVNGKDYFGGDVEAAIKNLPSDIVQSIQMVDDYGDQAAKTGIKDGDPQRILNIITRSDRSVGNRLHANLGAGNNNRYAGRLNLNRFNGNQQIGVQTSYNNTVTGIADQGNSFDPGKRRDNGSGSIGGGGEGISESFRTAINYADTWNQKLKFNGSYSFNTRNNNSLNSSVTQQFTQRFGTVMIANNGTSYSDRAAHDFNGRLEYDIDSANYLQITPSFSWAATGSSNAANIFQTGGIKQERVNKSGANGSVPDYKLIALYTHTFAKPRRNVSVQLSFNQTDNQTNRSTENSFKFYNPVSGNFIKDSLVNLLLNNGNVFKNSRVNVTYTEPLNEVSRLEFNGQMSERRYDNSQVTDQLVNGEFIRSQALSKIYDYSFTEQRLALNYRYQKEKINLSLGIAAVPAVLSGTSQTLNTTTQRKSLNLIPVTRLSYRWSRQKSFNINYSGQPSEPAFYQIQDVPDISNPQNPVIGNPNLKASFRHAITSRFNNYLPNSRLNISASTQALFNQNKVIRNTLEIDRVRGKRETYFLNAGGDYSINGNYNISKQSANRKYRIGLNGIVNFLNGISMNNSRRNVAETWLVNQRLNLQIEPFEWLEVNPNIRYTYQNTNFSLPTSKDSRTRNWALSINGRFDFLKSFVAGYNVSKNFISGLNTNINSNPFIINSYISKDFYKRRATLRFQAFDILNQNNFIIRRIGDNSITDVKSNALSRYFMFSFSMRLQKWTGTPTRHGKKQLRRGDGSFQ